MEEIVMFGRRCGKTTMMNKRQELVDVLKAEGWEADRFGHFQKDVTRIHRETKQPVIRHMRVKLQATSCRIEVQSRINDQNEWIRVGGDYFTNIVKLDDGRLRVGTYFFGQKNQPQEKL